MIPGLTQNQDFDSIKPMELSNDQTERYSRHILLKEVGLEGQIKLLRSSVLLIGTGGLGSPIALYLAAAGVGTLGLADSDKVDISNLQRQIIHTTKDINREKVISASEKIQALNTDVKIKTHEVFVRKENIDALIAEYDFIIDATDNFPSKYLINDTCVREGKPFSHGGILRFEGQTFTHKPGTGCLRCLFPEPPEGELALKRSRDGVLGTIAGMLGTIQAAETLKYLLGIGNLLTDRILTFDALNMKFRTIPFTNYTCNLCK